MQWRHRRQGFLNAQWNFRTQFNSDFKILYWIWTSLSTHCQEGQESIISKTAWEILVCLFDVPIMNQSWKNCKHLEKNHKSFFSFILVWVNQSYRFKFMMLFCFFWDPCHVWGFMDIVMNIIFVKSASVQCNRRVVVPGDLLIHLANVSSMA